MPGDDIEGRSNIHKFVPWNSVSAHSLTQQLQAHIEYCLAEGYQVGLVAVLIVEDPKDPGRVYTPLYSEQTPEVSMFAAEILRHHILKAQGFL